MKVERFNPVMSIALFVAFLVALPVARAADPPDATVNPTTGAIEVTDAIGTTDETRIRHVSKPDDGGVSEISFLTNGNAEDLDPKIEVADDGTTWVTWWRNSVRPEVLVRHREPVTGEWSPEAVVNDTGEVASGPHLACDGSNVWVAYESTVPGGTSIIVKVIHDGPEPFPNGIALDTTSFAGDRDVRVHVESTRVWVTWIDDASIARWSRLDTTRSTWSLAQSVSYAGSTVTSARAAIRQIVLAER